MSHPLVPEVQKLVTDHPVVIFMKGTADFPQCGFSARAVQILKSAGVEKPFANITIIVGERAEVKAEDKKADKKAVKKGSKGTPAKKAKTATKAGE